MSTIPRFTLPIKKGDDIYSVTTQGDLLRATVTTITFNARHGPEGAFTMHLWDGRSITVMPGMRMEDAPFDTDPSKALDKAGQMAARTIEASQRMLERILEQKKTYHRADDAQEGEADGTPDD